ncbi:fungal specific transcription factor [Beauveria bassiana ARSEF 2860]|uniref:Fungal specific transcription factor n=1 Tax=Beauveria bassiana (strain ARSEF 2860) TaxID=655819 RepID=J5JAD9_BEAB2|nr:fungal specific transcription factor [Beauveria bassiana ARSEF 2860]EJP61006.1 fungal specific transcription factor [Beauveria bassiana ARSEF 2860]
MPRRQSVAYYACELCRRKKRKCDGDGVSPCKACRDDGADCVYLRPKRVSKADLRKELAGLQTINSEYNVLLDAISSRNTSPAQLNDIIQRLSDGQSRAEVAEMLTQSPSSRDRDRDRGRPSPGGSPTSVCTSVSSPETLLSSSQEGSKIPFLPVSAPTPRKTRPPMHSYVQANLGYYRSQLPQLFDFILARVCLSFCPISKAHLRADLESGAGQHCSPALLDALLALATVLAPEKMAAMVTPRTHGGGDDVRQGRLGDSFAREAIAALYNESGLPHQIADIQAVGVLAVYCLSCENIKDGIVFAGDFIAAITEQWEAGHAEAGSADRQTHASLYCGALSLNRLLFLIQDYHKTLDELAIKVGLDKSPLQNSSSADSTISKTNLSDDPFFMRDLSLLPNNPKAIAANLFKFTELVYKARYSSEETLNQAVKVYQDGLRWYESFLACTRSYPSETPLILFAHTYYQFGVMCLLTPYVLESAAIASDGTFPMVVCLQAAGSIKQLIQHYNRLYDDGQLLEFMPFFDAAALAFLETCDTKILV